jgi:hypothetical protein
MIRDRGPSLPYNLLMEAANIMASEAELLSTLIAKIYDAVLVPSQWRDALEKIAGFVRGSASNLFAEESVGRTVEVFHSWGVEPRS